MKKLCKYLSSGTDIRCNIIILYTRLMKFYTEINKNSEKSSFLLSELSEPLRMCLKADLFVANNVFFLLNIPAKFIKTFTLISKKIIYKK